MDADSNRSRDAGKAAADEATEFSSDFLLHKRPVSLMMCLSNEFAGGRKRRLLETRDLPIRFKES
jgi:hypothetical protein